MRHGGPERAPVHSGHGGETLVLSQDPIAELLRTARTIAVVGLSRHAWKDSHRVAAYLQRQGYRIVPIHPQAESLLGERVYPSLLDLPPDLAAEVDIVDVFRPSEEVPAIVDQALAALPNLKALWLQLGIRHEAAAARARQAGVTVVQDRCLLVEHMRRVGQWT